ncbi:phosphoribosylanthranilate isomerase [Nocardia asteroides]|uniref:phosphoribosylanthranilate isomerase n=1 Tax=Nocardia asteroides TaxID=1824 RepID=UPI001E2EEA64|nr:phosphoribosylanthranilate isomerase [Nocardia asteroides]UGT61441.1 phosphoribosylanthranilate isomerase [Nocardia asteroides]
MTIRAKICGIRSERDLRIAVEAGADAVGFICGVTHVSEDALEADHAAELSRRTPPFVTRVLVTHLADATEIIALADQIGVDVIQVHGLVTDETVRRVHAQARGRKVLCAVHVIGPDAIGAARRVAANCDGVLLDSRTAERLGGTGETHDWSISAKIVRALREIGRPVILAGGLDPGNVAAAIEAVRPGVVDVNSGVETPAGDKDAAACAAFVNAAHGAEPRR